MLNEDCSKIVKKHAIRLGAPLIGALLNMEIFADRVGKIENDGLTTGGNKTSSAKGLYQFVDGSVEPAVNRAARTIPMSSWMVDALVHKNANLLTRSQQTTLFLADILEKRGSDKYTKSIMKSGDKQSMLSAYLVLHHTNPDEATIKRANRVFSE